MLTTTQLKQFLRGHGLHCLGVFPLDRLPMPPRRMDRYCFIVNTDPANLPGKHWLAVYVSQRGHAEVFDSFAMLPPLRLQQWLLKYCKRWTYNRRFVQGPLTTLCGAYCIFFLTKRCHTNKNMHDIVKGEFRERLSKNDSKMRNFMRIMFNYSM